MKQYIAFLRGVNVSGQKKIKMETLRKVTEDAGFTNVKTYIQSGNLVFDSDNLDVKQLTLKLEELISTSFGFQVDAIVRKLADIQAIINYSFYNDMQSDDEKRYYITFLKEEYEEQIQVPVFSKNKDVEIFHQDGNNLFSVCTLYKGNYGFPNAFIEKFTGLPATTRNPITLRKILEL
jgi:uncharacterized protein (DUF1697 family)